MNKAFLKDLKENDIVVRKLHGGGFVTESLVTIEAVLENGIFIKGADGDYEDDSSYCFDLTTGKSCNNYIQGFRSELSRIATEEDKEELELD